MIGVQNIPRLGKNGLSSRANTNPLIHRIKYQSATNAAQRPMTKIDLNEERLNISVFGLSANICCTAKTDNPISAMFKINDSQKVQIACVMCEQNTVFRRWFFCTYAMITAATGGASGMNKPARSRDQINPAQNLGEVSVSECSCCNLGSSKQFLNSVKEQMTDNFKLLQ